MSHFSVKTKQRGPFLTMMLTAIKKENEYQGMETQHFNVYGLVEVAAKLKPIAHYSDMQVYVGLKKTKIAKDCTVSINISCEGTNKQFVCQNEWAEIPIRKIGYEKYFSTRDGSIYLFTILVDISIHTTVIVNSCVYQHLYEDTEFNDFKLQAEDGCVAVHKSVLLSHGEMFRKMLRGEWKETEEGSIDMAGVTVRTLQHLKDYMYLGTLPEEGLEQLLLLANRLLMDKLATECIGKIIELIKPETFNGLLEFACQNNMFDLVKAFLSLPDNTINQIQQLDINKKLPTSNSADCAADK